MTKKCIIKQNKRISDNYFSLFLSVLEKGDKKAEFCNWKFSTLKR